MTVYKVRNGVEVKLADGQYPYGTCSTCPVLNRCKRVSGDSPLPDDYLVGANCNGYIMLERALQLSNLPTEFRGISKDGYEFDTDNARFESTLKALFERSTDMVDNGSNVAFLHPQKGTGKTLAGTTILNEYIFTNCMTKFDYENPLAMYIKYGKWANDLRTQYQLQDPDFNLQVLQQLEAMKHVPLLMIDDIGSGRITQYIRDITYDLIDYRKEEKLSTIFTSNLTEAQLSHPDCLGDIITSRLFFNTIVYSMGGRDRRRETTMYID